LAGTSITVWVVSHSISADWDPLLDPGTSKRVTADAGEFLNDLLCAVMQRTFDDVLEAARRLDAATGTVEVEDGANRLRAALGNHDARWVWHWVTDGAFGIPVGERKIDSDHGRKALLAAAKIIDSKALNTGRDGIGLTVELDDCYLELAISQGESADDVRDMQRRQIHERRVAGFYPDAEKPIVNICVGQIGDLPLAGVVDNLVGEDPPDGLVAGAASPTTFWIPGDGFLQGMPVMLP